MTYDIDAPEFYALIDAWTSKRHSPAEAIEDAYRLLVVQWDIPWTQAVTAGSIASQLFNCQAACLTGAMTPAEINAGSVPGGQSEAIISILGMSDEDFSPELGIEEFSDSLDHEQVEDFVTSPLLQSYPGYKNNTRAQTLMSKYGTYTVTYRGEKAYDVLRQEYGCDDVDICMITQGETVRYPYHKGPNTKTNRLRRIIGGNEDHTVWSPLNKEDAGAPYGTAPSKADPWVSRISNMLVLNRVAFWPGEISYSRRKKGVLISLEDLEASAEDILGL